MMRDSAHFEEHDLGPTFGNSHGLRRALGWAQPWGNMKLI